MSDDEKQRGKPTSKTIAGDIMGELLAYRNDMQDLLKGLIEDKETMELIRKQNFKLWFSLVMSINQKLRQLGAVRPCAHCGSAGEIRDLSGKKVKCPVCRGTTFEPIL